MNNNKNLSLFHALFSSAASSSFRRISCIKVSKRSLINKNYKYNNNERLLKLLLINKHKLL
jgi:hypothetical protein